MQYFVQSQYHSKPAFSGFLPGIAGIHGIPLWVFYVNRGQGIASFGVESKDGCIAEFQSAARAYHAVREQGFRTFVRFRKGAGAEIYEPFQRSDEVQRNELRLGMDEVSLVEDHTVLGLRIAVRYRVLADAPIGGLLREVQFTNTGDTEIAFEFLDGLPCVVPAGVDYKALTTNLTTARAWMKVFPESGHGALYRVGASMQDTAEVRAQATVNCAAGYRKGAAGSSMTPLQLVYDPDILFAPDQFMDSPHLFAEQGLEGLRYDRQISEGRQHCAFFGDALTLAPGATCEYVYLYGGGADETVVRDFLGWFRNETNCASIMEAGRGIIFEIARFSDIRTGNDLFNDYCRQNFLDNVLRGGLPHMEGGTTYIPVYSRKHGDLERDYNWFVIPPEYYSQGWGNYRDVNQNRRCDLFFVPSVGREIIREFVSLIQTDGYNPLVVQGRTFRLPEGQVPHELTEAHRVAAAGAFSPGAMYAALRTDIGADKAAEVSAAFGRILGAATVEYNAVHGEGFWIDHWTYNNDLIETYLAIFPDGAADLFWGAREYPYYTSGHQVLPRHRKWHITERGVRQYEAVAEPEDSPHSCWMRDARGEIYRATLGEKLLGLAALKFLGRDALGIGVEMEAGKPGWYDALNGLPGILGSSLPEGWELIRLIRILLDYAVPEVSDQSVELAEETAGLYEQIAAFLQLPAESNGDLHTRWDLMARCREAYREDTAGGYSGRRVAMGCERLRGLLHAMERDVRAGLERGREVNDGVLPCYLLVQPRDAREVASLLRGEPLSPSAEFVAEPLPLFLEGFARALPLQDNCEAAHALHHQVMTSELYDEKLAMLRVNAPLDGQSDEIGRARAFTPGWLENGSIWMHMQYKYLLALLHAGLYDQFMAASRTMLVPFMDQDTYGRSTCENSSFIVSSLHPDEQLHGRGFVARLSGSTAEFISILQICLWGRFPFRHADGALELAFCPCLPAALFDDNDELSAPFLGKTEVTYRYSGAQDVCPGGDVTIQRITIHPNESAAPVEISGAVIPAPYAQQVREGRIKRITIELQPSRGAS